MNATKRIAFFLIGSGLIVQGFTQTFEEMEDSLITKLFGVWEASSDETRRHLNNDFKDLLLEAIEMEGSYDYHFDSLSNYMGTIYSPDDEFRMYNWNITLNSGTYEYFCYVQKVDNKGVTENVIELIESNEYVSKIEFKELEPYEWYGALYYDIVPFEKNDKQYYAILGIDMNDSWSKIKLIEVMRFDHESVSLGESVFKTKNGVQRRFFLECKADNNLTLRYEKKDDIIIFNHLTPMHPGMEDQPDFYVNDLSFDGFQWDKKKEYWEYVEDVDAQNSNMEISTHRDVPEWEDPGPDPQDPGER